MTHYLTKAAASSQDNIGDDLSCYANIIAFRHILDMVDSEKDLGYPTLACASYGMIVAWVTRTKFVNS